MKLEKIITEKTIKINRFILNLLPEILQSKIKEYAYRRLWWHRYCICGGRIRTFGSEDSYTVECIRCDYMYDED